jgi:hypothetical protein
MADDVGGSLPDGTHSSIILGDTSMADGNDCNSVFSLDESYPSSYFDRAEPWILREPIARSPQALVLGLTTRRASLYNQGPQRPCRCEGGHRSFRQCGRGIAPADPDLAARDTASRIWSSFPPWIMRHVSRLSVYIPAVATRRQEQESCILRDRMQRRGEVLQTDDETASPTFHVAASTATTRAIPNDCVCSPRHRGIDVCCWLTGCPTHSRGRRTIAGSGAIEQAIPFR